MGDISENFNRSEFACKCGCGLVGVSDYLISLLQIVRTSLGESMVVTSGTLKLAVLLDQAMCQIRAVFPMR